MEADLDLVRLNLVPGLTPRAAAALLDRFGSAGDALAAGPGGLAGVPGPGFFPLLTGLALIALGIGLALSAGAAPPAVRGAGRSAAPIRCA